MIKDRYNSLVQYQLRAMLFGALLLLNQAVLAQNRVVVVPLGGDDPTGNATEADVVAGKTFSNADGTEKIGSLEMHPESTTFTNSIGMRFNTLPAGSFTMGSPTSEPHRGSDEVEHTVTLTKAFRMQITEVTNAQWNAVIADTLLGINPSTSHTGDNYPVETVSWYDAIFFANRLSIDEGRSVCYANSGVSGAPGSGGLVITTVTQIANCTGYRLPTEAEWEYAARAGTTKAYANPIGFDDSATETGNGFNGNLHAMGWYSYNREMENGSAVAAYEDGTKPVAKKQANAWGLYDMHGNVFEWNWDWLAAYSGNAETDPSGPASGATRVIRGASWVDPAFRARSAGRLGFTPDTRVEGLGFRLVLPQVQ